MKIILNLIKFIFVIGLYLYFYSLLLTNYYGTKKAPDDVLAIGLIVFVIFCIFAFRYFFSGKKLNWRSGNLKLTSDNDYQRWLTQFSDENSQEHAIEFDDTTDDIYSSGEDEEDYQEILAEFTLEEQFSLLVGLVGLYGDGELSFPELYQLRQTIKKLNFEPQGLSFADRADPELCLDQKLVWVISIIKSSFLGAKEFSKEELNDLFKALAKAMDKSIEKSVPLVERKQYFTEIIQALIDIASADGFISNTEKDLIKIFNKSSKF